MFRSLIGLGSCGLLYFSSASSYSSTMPLVTGTNRQIHRTGEYRWLYGSAATCRSFGTAGWQINRTRPEIARGQRTDGPGDWDPACTACGQSTWAHCASIYMCVHSGLHADVHHVRLLHSLVARLPTTSVDWTVRYTMAHKTATGRNKSVCRMSACVL